MHQIFFFIKIHASFPEKLTKMTTTKKTPDLAMLKKVRKGLWIHSFIRIPTKNEWGLFGAKTHPPSKFHGNLFCSVCVLLLTNQLI